jgi:hypothetical protein
LLASGLLLHGGIMLIHGLVSFGLVMFAALILFLRPVERPFAPRMAWGRARGWLLASVPLAAAPRAASPAGDPAMTVARDGALLR